MQDEQLRYSFEDKFKEDLTTYLQGKQLVDNMLPDITDMEEKWLGIAEAYLPDGMREFANYPTVSLGWMMYIGMAIAKYSHPCGHNQYDRVDKCRDSLPYYTTPSLHPNI